jgi:hypothetical protein
VAKVLSSGLTEQLKSEKEIHSWLILPISAYRCYKLNFSYTLAVEVVFFYIVENRLLRENFQKHIAEHCYLA